MNGLKPLAWTLIFWPFWLASPCLAAEEPATLGPAAIDALRHVPAKLSPEAERELEAAWRRAAIPVLNSALRGPRDEFTTRVWVEAVAGKPCLFFRASGKNERYGSNPQTAVTLEVLHGADAAATRKHYDEWFQAFDAAGQYIRTMPFAGDRAALSNLHGDGTEALAWQKGHCFLEVRRRTDVQTTAKTVDEAATFSGVYDFPRSLLRGAPVARPEPPPALPEPPPPPSVEPGGGEAAGWITGASVDPSVVRENAQWVRIRANLVLDGLQGQEVFLHARFQFSGTTTLLRDSDNQWRSTDGLVCSEAKVIPQGPRANVQGMEVWIPVGQLHLAQDSLGTPLVALLTVVHRGRALASVTTAPFTVQAGPPAAAGPSAEVKAIWFTQNVVKQGQRGVEINVQFVVSGCVGRDVAVLTWFYLDGVPLKDLDRQFATTDGLVAATTTVRPIHPVAVFNDCRLFMPYAQLHMARGAYNIQVIAGIFCDRHLSPPHKPVPFQFTQP